MGDPNSFAQAVSDNTGVYFLLEKENRKHLFGHIVLEDPSEDLFLDDGGKRGQRSQVCTSELGGCYALQGPCVLTSGALGHSLRNRTFF